MSLDHELERIARILAADQGLVVHVRGAAAYAIPGEVTIPSIDTYDRLGRNASKMVHGLTDHETGHSVWTDFDCMGACRERDHEHRDRVFSRYSFTQQEREDFMKYKSPALASLLNAVEDGWIEQAQGAKWPGCKQNLLQKNRWWWEQDVRESGSCVATRLSTSKPFEAYLLALTMIARKSVSMAEIREASEKIHEALVATWALVEEIDSLDNSGDALKLSLRIIQCFDQDAPEEDPKGVGDEGDPEDGDDDQEGEPGDGDEQDGPGGDEDQDGDPEDSEDGEGDDEAPGGSEGDDEGEPEPGDEGDDAEDGDDGRGTNEDDGEDSDEGKGEDTDEDGEGDGDGEPPPPLKGEFKMDVSKWHSGGRPLTPEDSIAKVLHGILDERDATRPYMVFSHEWDQELDLSSDDNSDHSNTIERIQKEARESVGTLANTFEAALQARREKRPVPGSDEGIADPNLLAAFSLGSVPVDEMYLQYVNEDDTDVAVGILCDCSGSTGSAHEPGSVSNVLRLAVIAMSQAMAAAQVAHEVTGFTCVADDYTGGHEWFNTPERLGAVNKAFSEMRAALTDAQERGTDVFKFARSLYGRGRTKGTTPSDHSLLLPAHAIFKGFAQSDIRGLARITGIHENLDGEALLWQARRLALRPEKRRVMFVFSDGTPLGSRIPAQGQRYLRETIKRITEAGIEVYAIGIKTSYVRNFYPHWWVVNDLDDLCEVAMAGLSEALLTARQEHQWVDLSA